MVIARKTPQQTFRPTIITGLPQPPNTKRISLAKPPKISKSLDTYGTHQKLQISQGSKTPNVKSCKSSRQAFTARTFSHEKCRHQSTAASFRTTTPTVSGGKTVSPPLRNVFRAPLRKARILSPPETLKSPPFYDHIIPEKEREKKISKTLL